MIYRSSTTVRLVDGQSCGPPSLGCLAGYNVWDAELLWNYCSEWSRSNRKRFPIRTERPTETAMGKIEEQNREDWYLLFDRLTHSHEEVQEADLNRVFDLIVKQAVWADAWIVPIEPPLVQNRYNDWVGFSRALPKAYPHRILNFDQYRLSGGELPRGTNTYPCLWAYSCDSNDRLWLPVVP